MATEMRSEPAAGDRILEREHALGLLRGMLLIRRFEEKAAELYRTKEEVEEWKRRCPLLTFQARLREEGILGDEDLTAIEAAVAAEIGAAVAFAESGLWEPVEDLMRDVCTPAQSEEGPNHESEREV